MTLEINDFINRLNQEAFSEAEIANLIYEEIRKAEELKVSFVDEIDKHPGYVVEVSDKIDTYVFELQELEKKILPMLLPLDQQTALSDEDIRRRMAEQIEILKQFHK